MVRFLEERFPTKILQLAQNGKWKAEKKQRRERGRKRKKWVSTAAAER
jgi:hypothetical protein